MSKNIKSGTTNILGYTGIVKLSQYTNGKKYRIAEVHNEGGKPLFNFIADCLAGDFEVAKRNRPTKILLLNRNANDNTLATAGETGFIYLLTKPERVYSSENKGVVKYSFMIPQEYFAGTDFNAIGLYTSSASDIQDYAALCTVNKSEWELSITSVLVLDWELYISNENSEGVI